MNSEYYIFANGSSLLVLISISYYVTSVSGFMRMYCTLSCIQALRTIWREYRRLRGEEGGGAVKDEEGSEYGGSVGEESEGELMTCCELVLDSHDQLCEMTRMPAENDVSPSSVYTCTDSVVILSPNCL